MKKKRKDINGRTYSKFGYCLHVALTALGFISFFLVLGFTGSCEHGEITVREYILRVVPSLTVMCSCILLHEKIFD